MRLLFLGILAAGALAWTGCLPHGTREPEQLYYAVEINEGGTHVGSPKVVGLSDHQVTVEKRERNSGQPEYQLMVASHETVGPYELNLRVWLPSGWHEGRVKLWHGEEAVVALDDSVELKVLLMRVDSPEFRMLIADRSGPRAI